jgi:hypothetical protein
MSRTLSPTAIRSINDNATQEIWLVLVHLSNEGWAEDVYLARNNVEIVHQGQVYQPFPFDLDLPDQTDDAQAVLSWVADNTDQQIFEILKGTSTPITADVRWILASEPDTIVIHYPALEMRGFNYDEDRIFGQMQIEPLLDRPLGWRTMTPGITPGIF